MRYLSAHYVFLISSPPLKNGIVCVDENNVITDVIDTGGQLEEREKLEFYNGILVPGFVNAHCHLELSHLRGAIDPHGGLPDFISSIGKIRQANEKILLEAAKAANDEMERNGIVAVGDISNHIDTVRIKHKSRIWYHNFVEVFGLDNVRAKEIFTTAKKVQQEYHKAGFYATIVPHALYSVSAKLWETLSRSYAMSPPRAISMHHQESNEETNVFFEGKGELADTFRENGLLINDGNIPPGTILYQLDRYFKWPSRCLLVHNIFSSKDDLSKYVSTQKKYYFVLCPGSNLFIQNRLPNLDLFALTDDLNVCLGTDSLASNTCLSILEEMKIVQRHAPGIPLSRLLRWATLNGAKALNLDYGLGSFEKKKCPGINLITNIDYDRMQLTEKSTVEVIIKNGKFCIDPMQASTCNDQS